MAGVGDAPDDEAAADDAAALDATAGLDAALLEIAALALVMGTGIPLVRGGDEWPVFVVHAAARSARAAIVPARLYEAVMVPVCPDCACRPT